VARNNAIDRERCERCERCAADDVCEICYPPRGLKSHPVFFFLEKFQEIIIRPDQSDFLRSAASASFPLECGDALSVTSYVTSRLTPPPAGSGSRWERDLAASAHRVIKSVYFLAKLLRLEREIRAVLALAETAALVGVIGERDLCDL